MKGTCLALLILLGGCGGEGLSGERTLRLAAASDLRFALPELAAQFQRTHPEIRLLPSYASSGTLYAQVLQGASFDLFLSADLSYVENLERAGRVVSGGSFVYARGRLVLWVPHTFSWREEELPWEVLGSLRRLAMANPRHAPYGRAARQALQKTGWWERVEGRLVLGDSVAQAAQFVQSGGAEAGLIALSLALAPPLRERGRFWEVPASLYDPLLQAGGVLREGDQEAARAFAVFLQGPQGRRILKRFGFTVEEP